MFQQTPSGSPLDPRRKPVGVLAGLPDPLAPLPAQGAPMGALSSAAALPAQIAPVGPVAAPQAAPGGLPQAPVKKARINPFDRDHIASSLAAIGKGFAGAHSFGEGLANAAGGVAGNVLEERNKKATTEVGGPDNAFEITTNPDGTRTYKKIGAVDDYLTGKDKAKNAPKPQDTANFLGDSLYAIEQLAPEQRPDAYKLMMREAQELGYNVTALAPQEYSPTYAKAIIGRTIGARQGSANAATASNRAAIDADRDASRAITERRVNASIGNAAASNARAAESHRKSMRSSPPSTRKKSTNSDLDYLR